MWVGECLHFVEGDPFVDCGPAFGSVAFECCSLENDSLTVDDVGVYWSGKGVAGQGKDGDEGRFGIHGFCK